jgi:ribonucleoside-diphosphate reductase subunit M2
MSEIESIVEKVLPAPQFVEELLLQDDNRFVLFPIKYQDVWQLYKKSVDCLWKVEDIDFSKDLKDWNGLSKEEKHFIKLVLAFFSSSDGIVCENLSLRFSNEIQVSEVRAFYAFQNFMESVHSETYSLLIETYIDNIDEKDKLFKAALNFPSIEKKTAWGKKWINDNRSSFNTRLVAFAIIEGIFFSSSFAAIFWIKQRNILPGLCLSNEYISRDESLHVEHACLLYSKLKRRVPKKKFIEIMKEAVEIEIEFICSALPYKLISMNSGMMTEYVKFVADRLCLQLGYDKIYSVSNPFLFMELISIETKTNFFEHRVSEYALANKTKDDKIFDMGSDF